MQQFPAAMPVTRRRILYLADSLPNGGAERQLTLLLRHLPNTWARRVWSLGGGSFAGPIRDTGVRLTICPRTHRFDVRPALSLWRLMTAWRPNIVHSWGWMASLAAYPACRLLGIPLIDGTIRAGFVLPGRRPGNRWVLRRADRVIANSRAGLRAWGIPAARGRVVYNGFDFERLAHCGGAPAPNAGTFTAVMTGRIAPGKEFCTFLGAARLLTASGDAGWRFVAVANGAGRAELMDGARDLVQQGIVEFPDPSLEVLPSVIRSHAGVLMSDPAVHSEGCSNSIMEYMACGLPVISTDSGGNRELVEDGHSGCIIPCSPEALAAALRNLRSRPDEAARMGAAGRERIRRNFSVEEMVARMLVVYAEVL